MAVRVRVLASSEQPRELHDVEGPLRALRSPNRSAPLELLRPALGILIEGDVDVEKVAASLTDRGIDHRAANGRLLVRMHGVSSALRETLAAVSAPALDALDRAVRAWNDGASDVSLAGGSKLRTSRRCHVMGILNVTPDSFSDGGRFYDHDAAAKHALAMLDEGADIIDVGGESTRPGAEPVDAAEEIRRVVPTIEAVRARSQAPVSIDTMKASVARAALDAGATIVNDVSAGRWDPEMLPLCAERGVPVVVMHMKGEPRTMQQEPRYDDVVADIYAFLAERAEAAVEAGVRPERIMIDPGFGFGKTREHNLTLLRRLREFTCLGFPVLVGTSRKSFIGLTLDLPVDDRGEGTAATVALAVSNGAAVLRVHDVGPMRRIAGMVEAVMGATGPGGSRERS